MKASGKAKTIQGKVTVEYAGKGPRKQEVEQGRLAFEVGNLALQLLTKDVYYRVEVVKATCIGTYKDYVGHPFSEEMEVGDYIDFMVVWTGPIGKAKITFHWVRPEEELSEFILTGIEHPFGRPSAVAKGTTVRAKSFREKTETVATELVKDVARAIEYLKEPLTEKTREVSKASQEVSSLIETPEEAVV